MSEILAEYMYKIPHGLYLECRKIIDNYNLYDSIDEIITEGLRNNLLQLNKDLK